MPAATPDRGPGGTAATPDLDRFVPADAFSRHALGSCRSRCPSARAAHGGPALGTAHAQAGPSRPARTRARKRALSQRGGHVGPARSAALSHSGRAASATRRLHPGRPGGPRPWPAKENRRPGVTTALSPLPASPSPRRATGPRPLLRTPLAATQPGFAARA